MMSVNVHKRIKTLIEETKDAYRHTVSDSPINADYADYAASMALCTFRDVLASPELTSHQLSVLLRKGIVTHKSLDPSSCWSTFMANYITHASNGNTTVQ